MRKRSSPARSRHPVAADVLLGTALSCVMPPPLLDPPTIAHTSNRGCSVCSGRRSGRPARGRYLGCCGGDDHPGLRDLRAHHAPAARRLQPARRGRPGGHGATPALVPHGSPADQRAGIRLVTQTGVGNFVTWLLERAETTRLTAEAFRNAPRDLARRVSLRPDRRAGPGGDRGLRAPAAAAGRRRAGAPGARSRRRCGTAGRSPSPRRPSTRDAAESRGRLGRAAGGAAWSTG